MGVVDMRKVSIKKTITNMLELPKEIVLNLPMISIIGNEELHIENYKGVIEYNLDYIRINTSVGIVKIQGKNLMLKQITSENITVSGSLSSIEYTL